jgi:hypothetical protein
LAGHSLALTREADPIATNYGPTADPNDRSRAPSPHPRPVRRASVGSRGDTGRPLEAGRARSEDRTPPGSRSPDVGRTLRPACSSDSPTGAERPRHRVVDRSPLRPIPGCEHSHAAAGRRGCERALGGRDWAEAEGSDRLSAPFAEASESTRTAGSDRELIGVRSCGSGSARSHLSADRPPMRSDPAIGRSVSRLWRVGAAAAALGFHSLPVSIARCSSW